MKIKHFVITRFLSSQTLGLGNKIFDEDIINDGINYAKDYFIPSLNNQTNKNFEVIFMINEKHDTVNSSIKKLYDMPLTVPFHVVRSNECMDFCKEQSVGYDWMICTRMDYDDLVKNTAVDEVQKHVEKNQNADAITYGYNEGLSYYNGDLYVFDKPGYDYKGYFSVFESVCFNLKHEVGFFIYNANHTELKQVVQGYCTEHGLTCKVIDTNDNMNFVWVRHKNTGTELLGNPVINKNRIKNKVPASDMFKQKFGITLK